MISSLNRFAELHWTEYVSNLDTLIEYRNGVYGLASTCERTFDVISIHYSYVGRDLQGLKIIHISLFHHLNILDPPFCSFVSLFPLHILI